MHVSESTIDVVSDPKALANHLACYREPNVARSVSEIVITAVPLVLLWIAMWKLVSINYWLCLPLSVPAAGLLIRLFIIQHDCGHGAFFHRRGTNDWVGRVLGVITLVPYDVWRHSHAIHHATSGNLGRRGTGDIDLLTVREYERGSARQRFAYRLYRHPLVMFLIGPVYYFLLQLRLPVDQFREGWRPWVSAMATNAGAALLVAVVMWSVGVEPALLVHLPIMIVACAIGGWMFYVQHQFADTFWADTESWNFHEAALQGSSYYDLPGVLRWFTANIGMHHVHHLCSRIPYYRLPEVLRDYPQLATIGRLTLIQSLRCAGMTLWDESQRRLISLREMRSRRVVTGPTRTVDASFVISS